jgi:dTDP-4-dehydrorhamnose 3,5-epimerase
MLFEELEINNVWLLKPQRFIDERGHFFRHFCRDEFIERGLNPNVAQGNLSYNEHKHTLRGFHYQFPPFWECKTFSCVSGALYAVVIDLRPQSPTFCRWTATEMNSERGESLYVPYGCANAFLTLEDKTLVHYYMSDPYRPGADGGIRYNDPYFAIEWPFPPAVISEKDQSFPLFDRAKHMERY